MAATIEAGKPTATPKPTDAPEPTATIDIHAAATLQKQATQQQAQINATIYSELRTQNAKTESALATIRALTPSNTPTITPSPTHTLPSLPTATPTLVKTVFLLNNCNLASLSAPAGLIIFMVGAAWAFDTTTTTRESQQDQTKVIFGDSAAVITVDDKPIQPMLISPQGLPLDDRGRTDLREETPGLWGYETYAQIVLASGVYAVRSEWRRANGATEINSCSVTIK